MGYSRILDPKLSVLQVKADLRPQNADERRLQGECADLLRQCYQNFQKEFGSKIDKIKSNDIQRISKINSLRKELESELTAEKEKYQKHYTEQVTKFRYLHIPPDLPTQAKSRPDIHRLQQEENLRTASAKAAYEVEQLRIANTKKQRVPANTAFFPKTTQTQLKEEKRKIEKAKQHPLTKLAKKR